jgi:restriction endonuclease S subunit
VRYRALLDELEAVEINLSELNKEFRVDSEFFKKEILLYENRLKNYKYLKELGTFLIGPFGSTVVKENYVDESNNYYIRGLDIGDFFLKTPEARIDNKLFNNLTRFHVKFEDIFITVVGTLGKSSIITDENIQAVFSCKSTIFRSNINPYFMTTFFNTNIGYKLLLRGKRGAIQEGLNLPDLQEIKVPIVSEFFQVKIEHLVKLAHSQDENSKSLYQEAEEILLKELDLLNFEPTQNNISVKSFSESFLETGRLDSEYYQPKYDEIVERIQNVNYEPLGLIVDMKKSIEPGSKLYQSSGIEFIRVSNLTKYGLTKSDIYLPNDFFTDKALEILQPKKDTILLSKDGTVGIAYTVKNETEVITSGAILHLNVTDKKVLPEYLSLVLNSIVVQMQSQRDAGGSIIQHWKPSEIQQVLIPILDLSLQQEINSKIKHSFQLKSHSKELLELAKQAVEIAIEEGEEVAMKHLEGVTIE